MCKLNNANNKSRVLRTATLCCSHTFRGPFIWSFFETGSRSWAQFDVGFLKGIIKLDKSLSNITPPRHNK